MYFRKCRVCFQAYLVRANPLLLKGRGREGEDKQSGERHKEGAKEEVEEEDIKYFITLTRASVIIVPEADHVNTSI